jgi:hypothetical protein
MEKKRNCPICNKDVDIMHLVPDGEHFRQMLSCGHSFKFANLRIVQTIPIKDEVELEVIKVRTLGETPIFVTDSSGTSVT